MCWYCGCHTKVAARSAPLPDLTDRLIAEIDLVGGHAPGHGRKAAQRRDDLLGIAVRVDDAGVGIGVEQVAQARQVVGAFQHPVLTPIEPLQHLQLARDFVLQTVGEYVESQEQSEHLRRLGVDFGQGYLFGKPEPLDAMLAALVERESAAVRSVLDAG